MGKVCCCLVTESCLTLSHTMDWSLPGSSVHGILQAKIVEWVAISSMGSSWPRIEPNVSCIAGDSADSLPLSHQEACVRFREVKRRRQHSPQGWHSELSFRTSQGYEVSRWAEKRAEAWSPRSLPVRQGAGESCVIPPNGSVFTCKKSRATSEGSWEDMITWCMQSA